MPLDSTAELKAALTPIAEISRIIAETRKQFEVKLASKFSIFDQMNYGENDISRVIAHLLDPKGSHSQGSRFLKAYLQMLLDSFTQYNKKKENTDNQYNLKNIKKILDIPNLDEADVRCEDSTKDGRRIDITVTWDDSKKFGIENKLTAGDQKEQVPAYLKSLPDEGFLVYLSIEDPEKKLKDGRLSITPDDAAPEIGNGRLFLTQYKPHISDWIDECLKISESDKIRWYLTEIKQLVAIKFYGGNSEMDSSNAVVELLLSDERAFEAALMVVNSIDQMKEQLAQKYLHHIHDELEKGMQKYENWKIDFNDGEKFSGHWCPIKITSQDCDMSVYLSFDKATKGYKRCIYGIFDNVAEKSDGEGKRSQYFDAIKAKAKEILPQMSPTLVWPGIDYFKSGQYSGQYGDWMANDFVEKLYEFHIGKESELFVAANTLVKNMLELLEMVDRFFKEQGVIK